MSIQAVHSAEYYCTEEPDYPNQQEFVRLFEMILTGTDDEVLQAIDSIGLLIQQEPSLDNEQKIWIQGELLQGRFETHMKSGRIREAIEDVLERNRFKMAHPDVFKNDPNDSEEERLFGLAQYAHGETDLGIETLKRAARMGDSFSVIFLQTKGISVDFGDVDVSFSMEDAPWHTDYKQAMHLFLRGEYEETIALCNALKEKYAPYVKQSRPGVCVMNLTTSGLSSLSGDAYMMMGKYEDAIRSYLQEEDLDSTEELCLGLAYKLAENREVFEEMKSQQIKVSAQRLIFEIL
jgi:tetratricopeptide (TPR) repeat protein